MKWGALDIELVSDGSLWLDGGAMFGVVPKTLWNPGTACDERNRIELGTILVRAPGRNILIDTGCGEKYSPKEIEIYSIDRGTRLMDGLSRLGLGPRDIDVVINTHFHFDHAGGNTIREGDRVIPAFPNAVFLVQQQEFQDATHPNLRNSASYRSDNWECLRQRGQIELIDGERDIAPGLRLIPTPGHTLGHQSVLIDGEDRKLFYIADLCPTQAHVPLAWVMGFDLYPVTTVETRRRIYERALDEDWIIFFEHDHAAPTGRLREMSGRYWSEKISILDN